MEGLNIRHFKLLNGEEIIALLAVKNDDNFIIERPVRIPAWSGHQATASYTCGYVATGRWEASRPWRRRERACCGAY